MLNKSLTNTPKCKKKFIRSFCKHQFLIFQNNLSYFSANRELTDLQKRYDHLHEQHRLTRAELAEKHAHLEKLKNASKDFYIEYDTLKNKYDVETDAYRKYVFFSIFFLAYKKSSWRNKPMDLFDCF